MNKIFKIVFNAARDKMMVVNEATSSVQTGKKAAVTVAVVAALAAGSAMAADWEADGKAVVIDGNTSVLIDGVAGSAVAVEAAIFGGVKETGEDNIKNNMANGLNSNVTLKGEGTFEDVIGGHYAVLGSQNKNAVVNSNGAILQESADITLGDLSVTIEGSDVTMTRAVVGGSKIARNSNNGNREQAHVNLDEDGNFKSGIVKVKTNSTNVEIFGGNFGVTKDYNSTYGNPERVVAGGDYIKDIGWSMMKTESDIGTTNLTIHGGTFNTMVIGGSYANIYGDHHTAVDMHVGTANTTINGGTFNRAIYAGSAIYTPTDKYESYHEEYNCSGSNLKAHVDVANLTIDGATAKDVYAGGLVQFVEIDDIAKVTVGKTNLTITNSTVENVYGVTGYSLVEGSKTDRTETPKPTYTDENGVEQKDTTKVDVKLTNTTVTNTVDVQDGSVELRVEGDGKTSVGKLDTAESVSVLLTADGVFNDANAGSVEALTEAIQIAGENANVEGASIKLDAGDVMGVVTATIENGEVTGETVAVNEKTEALADKVTLAPQMITRILMNDLRKRMGDVRAGEGTHGAWARYNGGQMAGQGVDADFHMVQVGVDTVPVADAPRFGVAFSYAQTESDDAYGTTDMDAYSLAFYGTKMYDNGMFVDVIGRMATMDTDMVNAGYKAKMDNVALSLSGEFGWRFDVTDSFFVEPSVEATYTYTNADTFTMGSGKYELEATDSLVGRAGFAAGFKCPANKGDVYVRAAVVHEFMGDTTMNSWVNDRAAAPVVTDGKDTWFEYAIGAQFNVNKNAYVYADVERTEGANIDEDWRANVGVRYAF